MLKWERRENNRTFEVEVFDQHRLKLVEEMGAYYAPFAWERTETPIDRLDERGLKARRVRLQKARRKRWAARTKDPALWHAVSYTPTHCWEA